MRPVIPKITSGCEAGDCDARGFAPTYSTVRVKNFFTPSKKVCSFG